MNQTKEGMRLALIGGIYRDQDALNAGMRLILDGGNEQVFIGARALAQLVINHTPTLQGDWHHGFQIADVLDGHRIVNPDENPEMRPLTWAARFVAAEANDDTEQQIALFDAYELDDLVRGFATLLEYASALVREELPDAN